MADQRVGLEPELQDLLDEVMDFMRRLTAVRGFKTEYRELLGRVRDMKVRLENKESGCFTGRHKGKTEQCHC